ncbi:MAG: tryptophan--tRNA ligase [archaeon]
MANYSYDAWSSELPDDYNRIVKDFGLDLVNDKTFENPNRLMRRGITFAGRGLKELTSGLKEKKQIYSLTGIMPSADRIHFGNKMTIENIAYFQKEHNAVTFLLIADLESLATRKVSLEVARKRALEFHIPAYLALGLDSKKTFFYFQSENTDVLKIAVEAAQKMTLNEFRSAYGTAEPSRIVASITQIGDMLFPQLKKPCLGVIPVGIDQEPHIRLCRDFQKKDSNYKHFTPITSIYHKFTPSLDGEIKMSKSKPGSCIEIPEDIKVVCKKINNAFSGGKQTVEEQRKLGAVIEKDMPFMLLEHHLIESDSELKKIRDDYASGKMLSGEVKQLACEKMTEFMEKFNERLEKARDKVKDLKYVKNIKEVDF